MGYSFIFLFLILAVSVGMWTGLIGLRRNQQGQPGQRGQEWWLMAVGAGFVALSPVLSFLGFFSFGFSFFTLGQFALPVGFLLFAVGFALHGMRIARVRERVAELEQLTQAMDEEITRLRGDVR